MRKTKIKVMPNGNIRGYIDDGKKSSASELQAYSPANVCGTLTTARPPQIIAAALRGRDPSNPSNRDTKGVKLEQRLELGGEVSNTITSVRKDCLVAEQPKLLIRKLTEREALRLMDVPERYIDMMLSSGVSRTAIYKAAGNSIVVACMEHIFNSLFNDNSNPRDETGQYILEL